MNYIVLYDSMIYIFWSSFSFEDLHISFGLGAHFCRSSFHISKPIIIVMTDFLSHSLFFMFFFIIQVWKCRVVPSRGSQNLVHLPPDMQLNSELIHNDNFLDYEFWERNLICPQLNLCQGNSRFEFVQLLQQEDKRRLVAEYVWITNLSSPKSLLNSPIRLPRISWNFNGENLVSNQITLSAWFYFMSSHRRCA